MAGPLRAASARATLMRQEATRPDSERSLAVCRRGQVRGLHVDGGYRQLELRCANMINDPAVGKLLLAIRDVTEPC